MGVKFSNNASTTLATAINTTATAVVAADASDFPALGGSDHSYITLQSGSTIEIVKATALSSNTFTVVRAQGGTSAASFGVGAQIELRMNTVLLQDIKDEGPDPAVLKVDQSNNRVGILDTTPSVSLDAGSATDALHVPSGTTGQRPTGAAGMFRWNSTETQFEGYDGTEWGEIGGGGATLAVDNFTGDGSDTTFTMAADPLTENNTDVFVDGVYQFKNTYSVSGTTLTFSEAPANGALVEVMRISASAVTIGTPDDDTVSTVKVKDDAITYAKIQNVSATDRLLGRDTAGAGIIEEITPANVRTMINVEDGATPDQTGAEIKAAYEAEANAFTDAQFTKLSGIETSATADQSDAEVETAYNNQVAVATQAEAEAGSSTAVKRWTPERVGQAISALASGGLSLQATPKTVSFTAVAGEQYLVDTTNSALTMTFPASPSVGDTVGVIDYAGTFHINHLTLGRNSVNVLRVAADGVIDSENWSTNWMYVHATPGWLPVG